MTARSEIPGDTLYIVWLQDGHKFVVKQKLGLRFLDAVGHEVLVTFKGGNVLDVRTVD